MTSLFHWSMYVRRHQLYCHLMEVIFFFNPLAYKLDPMLILSVLSTKNSPLLHRGILHAGLLRVMAQKDRLEKAVKDAYKSLIKIIPSASKENPEIDFLNEMFAHLKNCAHCQHLKTIEYENFTFGNNCRDQMRKEIIKTMSEFISKADDYPMTVRVQNINKIRSRFRKALKLSSSNLPFTSAAFPDSIRTEVFNPKILNSYNSSEDLIFVKRYVANFEKTSGPSKKSAEEPKDSEEAPQVPERPLIKLDSDEDSDEVEASPEAPVKRKERKQNPRRSKRLSKTRSFDFDEPSTSRIVSGPSETRKTRFTRPSYRENQESSSDSSRSASPVLRKKRKNRILSEEENVKDADNDIIIIDGSDEEEGVKGVSVKQETSLPTPPASEIADDEVFDGGDVNMRVDEDDGRVEEVQMRTVDLLEVNNGVNGGSLEGSSTREVDEVDKRVEEVQVRTVEVLEANNGSEGSFLEGSSTQEVDEADEKVEEMQLRTVEVPKANDGVDGGSLESFSTREVDNVDEPVGDQASALDLSRRDENNVKLEIKVEVKEERVDIKEERIDIKMERVEEVEEPEIFIVKEKVGHHNCKCCKPAFTIKDD